MCCSIKTSTLKQKHSYMKIFRGVDSCFYIRRVYKKWLIKVKVWQRKVSDRTKLIKGYNFLFLLWKEIPKNVYRLRLCDTREFTYSYLFICRCYVKNFTRQLFIFLTKKKEGSVSNEHSWQKSQETD